MPDRCRGTNVDGAPCSAQPQPGQSVCIWHDPGRAQDRAAWRRQGGHGKSSAARASKRLPRELKDVQLALCRALAALEAGDLEPPRATAMAALGRAIVTVTEAGTLEERLAALEAAADMRRPG